MDIQKLQKSAFTPKLADLNNKLKAARLDKDNPQDISLDELLQSESSSFDAMLHDMGIDPSFDTVENLLTSPELNTRWLVPEIWREAMRLGLRKAAIWPNIVSSEQSVSQTTIKMPYLNMADAVPKKVGEAETIPLGSLSYGHKEVSIGKMGRGIQMSYEVRQYVSLNIVSLFLEDMGIKMGMGLDMMAIDMLVNGDQSDGSESAPVIGIITPSTLVYKDLLKVWVRLARMGRFPTTFITGEALAIDILDMTEFKTRTSGTTQANMTLKTPVPNSGSLFVHGSIAANQLIIMDPAACLVKFNAQPLLVESEKIVQNQTMATYATISTGFGTLFRDGRIIVDRSLNISSATFPTYMDVDAAEVANVID